MIDPNMKTLGIREMNPMQIEALMDFIGTALKLATLTDDDYIIQETEAEADELIRMFGGRGVRLEITLD